MEHTKGKWMVAGRLKEIHRCSANPESVSTNYWEAVMSDGHCIAKCLPAGHPGNKLGYQLAEAEANAHLMAAAPRLLSLVRAYRTTYPLDPYAETADKVIKQAGG